MLHPSVKKLFFEQADYYLRSDQSAGISPIIFLFLNWATKHKFKRRIDICEFGGGGGLILSNIAKKYPEKINLTNIEIVNDYGLRQASKKIKFIHGSILDSKLPDKSFDAIIIRDVLHHLIGSNYKETISNQKLALKELKRLLRPNGAIFIEELVNQSQIAGRIIYELSKINSKIGLKSKYFQISPHTIIALLSSQKLTKICTSVFDGKNIIYKKFQAWPNKLRFKIIHLGALSGKQFFVIKKS
ncbi:MAG: hypothetical protein US94_C0031G0003 [Berkelbacteria bacterium GW2011_GWB1_38_5]|uniref:Methyltransferase type 11 domain-containing protein n=1 Tax=Berkelbacteria bacterium GW2011_GWB1_38_5 TaxID=1618336 RepID=A0A0G0N933_9BACT|nr:MAG: hypothetical protein US94_C0031G0003 [Berkelbacteria bacterium GW2011_GWB1_38_5]